MRGRRPEVTVPAGLVREIDRALAELDAARDRLRATLAGAPGLAGLPARRQARAEVTAAFENADLPLRRAATVAKEGTFVAWSRWRRRLSRLDAAKQAHLFAENDDVGALGLGSVRAVDTGMSGPSIGEMQHGTSRPAGATATYGLDMAAVLTPPAPATATPGHEPAVAAEPATNLPDAA